MCLYIDKKRTRDYKRVKTGKIKIYKLLTANNRTPITKHKVKPGYFVATGKPYKHQSDLVITRGAIHVFLSKPNYDIYYDKIVIGWAWRKDLIAVSDKNDNEACFTKIFIPRKGLLRSERGRQKRNSRRLL